MAAMSGGGHEGCAAKRDRSSTSRAASARPASTSLPLLTEGEAQWNHK